MMDTPEPFNSALLSLGFAFNPFSYLESSQDPYLSEYLVGHELFPFAWDDAPTLIFAPAGGGKTALRFLSTHSCWIGHGINHPFPLPYILPRSLVRYPTPTLDKLLEPLLYQSARILLLSLAYRPERLLGLTVPDQQRLTTFLQRYLPRPLSWYLDILASDPTPEALLPLLDRTYRLPNPPSAAALTRLLQVLHSAPTPAARPALPPTVALDELLSLLRETMKFRSVYLLLDGADGTHEGQSNPTWSAGWLEQLVSQSAAWSQKQFYLKGFLPLEVEEPLHARLGGLPDHLRSLKIRWTTPLLADIVRRRVYVASRRTFGTLGAISSPFLRDVETQLARAVRPFPREILVLVQQVLTHFAQRTGGQAGQLEPEDVEAAIGWYGSHPVTTLQEAAPLAGA